MDIGVRCDNNTGKSLLEASDTASRARISGPNKDWLAGGSGCTSDEIMHKNLLKGKTSGVV